MTVVLLTFLFLSFVVTIMVVTSNLGSGKTTFSTRLEDSGWGKRVSQDDLGSRAAVERTVVEELLAGRNVIIDRCNFDASQRKHWIGAW